MTTTITLLRIKDVERISGLKKSAIYQGVKDGTFPAPVRLSRRAVAWKSDELSQWIESRPRAVMTEPPKEVAA